MNYKNSKVYLFGEELNVSFAEKSGTFHVWVYSEHRLYNYYLTPNSLEETLVIADGIDLEWFAVDSLPNVASSGESGRGIKSNKKCFDPVFDFSLNRRAWNQAKKHLIGEWGDGSVNFRIRKDGSLEWLSAIPERHSFDYPAVKNANWWDFSKWTLSIGSMELGGIRFPVYGCDSELLLVKSNGTTAIAHRFDRKTEG
ncbi:hypothetical protein [Marinobacter salarius]